MGYRCFVGSHVLVVDADPQYVSVGIGPYEAMGVPGYDNRYEFEPNIEAIYLESITGRRRKLPIDRTKIPNEYWLSLVLQINSQYDKDQEWYKQNCVGSEV